MSIKVKEITPTISSFDENHPLYGKTVVFTGSLKNEDGSKLYRKDAMQAVVNLGGHVSEAINIHTDYLVIGQLELSKLKEGETRSSKIIKAEKLMSQGYDLRIIGTTEFLELTSSAFSKI